MNADEYRAKYGADIKAHQNQAWFVALMRLIEDQHPARRSPDEKDMNVRLNGSIAIFNEIVGYESLHRLIRSLTEEQEKPADEIPDDYREPERI